MKTLNELEPKTVFKYFEEICHIPHGSGNVKQISDYLVSFAKEHGLEYRQDEALNVVIKKPAVPGREKEQTVIIQGHMDMVAVKKSEKQMDMTKEGITPLTDGEMIWADDTSLGGDDGIAVAYALAVLSAENISHPALEVIITTDEETGMGGATALDTSDIKGRIMLNIDSEEEGSILVSCAGGVRVTCHLPIDYEKTEGTAVVVTITGLIGGHSGQEIDKEHGNANCLMGRFFYGLCEKQLTSVHRLEGGLADNAIPRECEAILIVPSSRLEEFEAYADEFSQTVKNELVVKDPDFKLLLQKQEMGTFEALSKESFAKLANLLLLEPNGVQAMSSDVKGLVQTSLNLGILTLDEEEASLSYAVRSSVASEKKLLMQKLDAIVKLLGGHTTLYGDYPGWEYKQESKLREVMCETYKNLTGKEMTVEAMHAGLECGIFASRLEGLDCVSFGPDMADIHTTEEKLNVKSVERTWKLLLEVLKYNFA